MILYHGGTDIVKDKSFYTSMAFRKWCNHVTRDNQSGNIKNDHTTHHGIFEL